MRHFLTVNNLNRREKRLTIWTQFTPQSVARSSRSRCSFPLHNFSKEYIWQRAKKKLCRGKETYILQRAVSLPDVLCKIFVRLPDVHIYTHTHIHVHIHLRIHTHTLISFLLSARCTNILHSLPDVQIFFSLFFALKKEIVQRQGAPTSFFALCQTYCVKYL